MATSNASTVDPYLNDLTAQIREIDNKIKAAVPKKLLDERAEAETALKHYKAFKKKQGK